MTARQRQRQRNDEDASEGDNDAYVDKESRTGLNDVHLSEVAVVTVENENDAAARTIAKINEKLQGFEEGTLGERQLLIQCL